LDLSPEILREKFFDWQCQSRMDAFRTKGGRPNNSMTPHLLDDKGEEYSRIIVTLVENDPVETTKMFEYNFKRTYDPAERYDKINKFLSSEFFIDRHKFSDALFATFPVKNKFIDKICKKGKCILDFIHLSTNYRLECSPFRLDKDEPAWENVFWHNFNFNPGLNKDIDVIKFIPNWKKSKLIRISE
tara:strand:+ start:589 stop:1149 length:561 start_codon:yes stop_codon:yes gene_type:complete